MIYLDHAATTKMSDEAIHVYSQVARSYYGNPSSMHDVGSNAANLLEMARIELAEILQCEQEGIHFTSGGSDANVIALQSMLEAHKHRGNHIITSPFEHASIDNFFRKMEMNGFQITYLPVCEKGIIDPADVKKAITDETILASIQHANGEIGSIQQIEAIGNILAEQGVLFHCDAVQSLGKIPIDIKNSQIDSLSVSSHKIYGPKGVGAAYMNPMMKWESFIPNTTHEGGFRPGTVDVPGITAFVTSTKTVCSDMMKERSRIHHLRKELLHHFNEFELPIEVEGPQTGGVLPHVLGLRIPKMEGQYVMLECNRYGIAISTGSACQVGEQSPSRTMIAIGRSVAESKQFIRLSFGQQTTAEEIQKTATVFQKIIELY